MLEELVSMQEGCQEKIGEDVKMVESVVHLLEARLFVAVTKMFVMVI